MRSRSVIQVFAVFLGIATFTPAAIAQRTSPPVSDQKLSSKFEEFVQRWRDASDPKQKIVLAKQALELEPQIKAWSSKEPRSRLRGELLSGLGNAYLALRDGNDADNLERAIAALEAALTVFTREAFPEDWAGAQNELAIAFATRVRGNRAENLERAIAGFEAARTVFTRDAHPRNWAQTQHNLASTLVDRILGDRAENLESAIVAYEDALTVRTREKLPEDWAATQFSLAAIYLERKRGERTENIDRAIVALEAVLTVQTRDSAPDEWASTQNLLALAFLADSPQQAENLERAINGFEAALTVLSREAAPKEWAFTQSNLGNAYSHRIRGTKSENLEHALAAFEAALTVFTREALALDWARMQQFLGIVYLDRITGERAENIERAIAAFEAALAVYTPDAFPRNWARIQENLGLAFFNRIRGERADNIERAISVLEAALTLITRETFPQDWARAQQTLGEFFRLRVRGERADNLERAIAAYQGALSILTREDSPREWGEAQNGFAIALADRVLRPKAENLERAIAAFEAAQTILTREAFPKAWALIKNNLAVVYRGRIRGERADNIELAISAFEAALAVQTKQAFPREWALTQANLGETFRLRLRGEPAENRERAIAALEAALTVRTREAFPFNHLQTARLLGEVLIEKADWGKAREVLSGAREAFQLLFAQGLDEMEARELIATAGPLFSTLAYVSAQLGQVEIALNLLNEGKGRLIAVALKLRSLELATNERMRLEELRSEIRQTSRNLEKAEGTARGASLDRLITQRRELLALVQKAEATVAPSGGAFALARELVRQGRVVVAPVITRVGAKFLIVNSINGSSELTILDLPNLTTDRLDVLMRGERKDGGMGGWLAAYNINYIEDQAEQNKRWPEWMAAIDDLGTALWRLGGDRLHAALKAAGVAQGAPLIFLPTGALGILPLGLAQDPASKRRFADDYEIVYAPSLETLAAAQNIIVKARSASLGAVINPTGDLPGTVKEGAIVASHFARDARTLLQTKAATVEAVLAALKSKTHWHFASHGVFSWEDARQSALVMHGHTQLTVGRLLETDGLGRPRLVVLSACETGLYDIDRSPDEFIGLPGTFMALGAAGVLGSLWPVSDEATALLIAKFYELHMTAGLAPPTALARAQAWLREATNDDLSSYARAAAAQGRLERRHLAEIERALGADALIRSRSRARVQLTKLDPKPAARDASKKDVARAPNPLGRPYAHPYFWAGFIHTGL